MESNNLILFDGANRNNLLPLTFTRPVADLRCGILTMREKWEQALQCSSSSLTQDYLSEKYPLHTADLNWVVNGGVIPDQELINAVKSLKPGELIVYDRIPIAGLVEANKVTLFKDNNVLEHCTVLALPDEPLLVQNPWDIFKLNGKAIDLDLQFLTEGRTSQPLSKTNHLIGLKEGIPQNAQLFIEEGAQIECAVLNVADGPIYIGKDATVMEGSVVRGPFALCEHATLKLSAKIYGPTTIGPHSKVGGEVNNSVIIGYSNKGHDGFLGNSVLGEWVNIGADSNNSNLKNNYANVKLWNYDQQRFVDTGLQFCGLIMGDHSKCGINTMFNTGTVVGISANIFGGGFPRNFIPSFSWGGAAGFTTYQVQKAFEVAERVMERRDLTLTEADKKILTHIFDISAPYRSWENK